MTALVALFVELVLPALTLSDHHASVAVFIIMAFSFASASVLFSLFFIKPLLYLLSIFNRLSAGNFDISDVALVAQRRDGRPKLAYRLYREMITDLHTLAARLQSAQGERDRLETAKKDWVSGVSHDLKTPLSYVMGYAGLLSKEDVDNPISQEDRASYMGLIYRQASYMNDLIQDLNLLYRQDQTGQLPLSMEEMDIVSLLRDLVVDMMNDSLAQQYSFSFEAEMDALNVNADRTLLHRAFQNILTNAVKHNPDGTEILIQICGDEDNCIVTIGDNGKGMSAETVAHLFDRYYREAEPNHNHAGGFGLVVVKNVMEGHGGTISVASTPGAGTSFLCTIPRGLSRQYIG